MLNLKFHHAGAEDDDDDVSEEDASFTTDIIRLYLNGIGKYPLLSSEREVELGRIIQKSEAEIKYLQNELDKIETYMRQRGTPTVHERRRITELHQIITQYLDMPIRLERSRTALAALEQTASYTKSDMRKIKTFNKRIKFMQRKCRFFLAAQEKLRMFEQSIATRALPTRSERSRITYRRRALENLQSEPQKVKAEQEFIHSNLRLVVSIAQEPQYKKIPLLDRIQAGNLGLMKAVHKFDPDRGYRFATYASFWIRKYIVEELRNQCRTIRLTEWVTEEIAEVKKMIEMLTKQFGRAPTSDEVADAIAERDASASKTNGVKRHSSGLKNPPEAIVDRYRHLCRLGTTFPLDHPIRDGDRRKLIETIEDPGCLEHSSFEVILGEQRMAVIGRLLSTLTFPPLGQKVLEALYFEDLNGQECADRFGISREWINKIHKMALSALQIAITRNVREISERAGMSLSARDVL